MECVKVLQVGLSSYPGGVENAIMNYFRFMDREKVRLDFVCMEASLAYAEEIEKAGSRIHYLPSPKRHMLRFAKALRRVINEGKYDIVHVNMLSAVNMFPAVFSKGTCAKRVIAHAHNASLPDGLKKKVHRILKHAIPLFANEWLACSEEAAAWLLGKKHAGKARIVKNAIDYSRFLFNERVRQDMRAAYGIGEGIPVIGHVGRFGQEKNQRFLIERFAEVRKHLPEAKLVLVGEGHLLETVRQQAADMGLADQVLFVGGVDDAAPFYQMMDVFCLPSVFEGLGIVAIEAQIAGLPCVCSTGVPAAAIITGKAKRVELQQPEAWVQSLVDMLGHARIGAVTEEICQAGYDAAVEAKKMEEYYLRG